MKIDELLPYQEKLLFDIETGGIKPGELMVMYSGRQMGKSVLNQYYGLMSERQTYVKLASAEVDNETWYTIRCNKTVGSWIRQDQNKKFWYEHSSGLVDIFDVHEKLYTTLILKWN